MDDLSLIIDFHKEAGRQGPGSVQTTLKALSFCDLDPNTTLKVLDIGSGTGSSSFVLAKMLNAEIIAVDFLQEFLDVMQKQIEERGYSDKIMSLCASMDDLPFKKESFDLILSEGAIYNMGFLEGIRYWKNFLKPHGKMIISEITWTTNNRPQELQDFWVNVYPQIDTASNKIKQLEECEYRTLSYFTLPEDCWLKNYYIPMQNRFDAFLDKHNHSDEAKALVESEKQEIALYEKFKNYYSYGMYIVEKI